jgi:hypothetical protein
VARQALEGVLPHQTQIPGEGAVAWRDKATACFSVTYLPSRSPPSRLWAGGKGREGGRVAAFRAVHSRSVAPGVLPCHPHNSVKTPGSFSRLGEETKEPPTGSDAGNSCPVSRHWSANAKWTVILESACCQHLRGVSEPSVVLVKRLARHQHDIPSDLVATAVREVEPIEVFIDP